MPETHVKDTRIQRVKVLDREYVVQFRWPGTVDEQEIYFEVMYGLA
jgi:hypothetical protein